MNKDWVIFHLKEGDKAIEDIINRMQTDPTYSEENFSIDIGHLYHHLNTAWNSRNVTNNQIEPGTDVSFNQWGQFPTDLNLMRLG